MTFLGLHSTAEFIVFLTSIFVGITMVMGVNAINSAPSFMLDYYKYIDKSPDAIPKYTNFWTNVLTYYSVITYVAQAGNEPLNLTRFVCRFSIQFRMLAALMILFMELIVIVVLPHSGASEEGAIAAIVLVAFFGGVARAYYENTGYALFGPCPSKMLSGTLVGVAVSGFLVSIIQIILKASMEDGYESTLTQSIIYFSISLAIMFVGGLLLLSLKWNSFARRYISEMRSSKSIIRNIYSHNECREPLNPDVMAAVDENGEVVGNVNSNEPYDGRLVDVPTSAPVEGTVQLNENSTTGRNKQTTTSSNSNSNQQNSQNVDKKLEEEDDEVREVRGQLDLPPLADDENNNNHNNRTIMNEGESHELTTAEMLQQVNVWFIIKQIWDMMLSCFLIFTVTYLMNPGVLIAIDYDDAWFGTIVMAVYNASDLVGRGLSMIKKLWVPRKVVFIVAITRIIFIPLLMLCADKKIPSHAAAYVFTAALGITNGFFGTLSMVYAPDTKSLRSEGERAMAGQATGVCLLTGCAVGAMIQIALVLPFN